MDRDAVNLYLDGLLALSDQGESSRFLLIEVALNSDNLEELLSEWLIVLGLDSEQALKLKQWFQLSYASIAEILKIHPRDVGQILRAQRSVQLPTYPPVYLAQDKEQIEGISCFMVEQHLSPYIDNELVDIKLAAAIHSHRLQCSSCAHRLNQYRQLQVQSLSARISRQSMSEWEWEQARLEIRSARRKRLTRYGMVFGVILLLSLLLGLVIWSKPEKMPNIYEIESD